MSIDFCKKSGARNIGKVDISLWDLSRILGLPEGYRIVDFENYGIENRMCNTVTLLIEGPTMPLVEPGYIAPKCDVLIQEKTTSDGESFHKIIEFQNRG